MKFLTSLLLSSALFLPFARFRGALYAQSSAPPAAQTRPAAGLNDAPNDDSSVALSQPVITVHGLCKDAQPGAGANCSKVVTREDFERLLSALSPPGAPLPKSARQSLARTYAETLAFEAAASREGLEDTAQYRETLAFVRLRAVADLYRRGLQEKTRTPAQEEIDSYYKQHLSDYERVKVTRVLIPRESPVNSEKDAFDKKARESADIARDRAAKGVDLETIQRDIYSALGLKGTAPTDLGALGRSAFIEKEAADIFALAPGGVTPVEVEPRNYIIYKVGSKEALSEEQVKAEIARAISQQKLRDAIKVVTDSAPAEFNEEYFGAGVKNSPAAVPAPPRMAH